MTNDFVTYIDFLENTGWDLAGDVRRQVSSCDLQTILDFRESYLSLIEPTVYVPGTRPPPDLDGYVPFSCPTSSPDDYRPVLIPDQGVLVPEGLDREKSSQLLKSLLLYAHAVVVPEHLTMITKYFMLGEDSAEGRAILADYLEFIAEWRPLIASGHLILYPREQFEGFERHPQFFSEEILQWGSEQGDRETARYVWGHHTINSHLYLSTSYGGSPAFPSMDWYKGLRALQKYSEQTRAVALPADVAIGDLITRSPLPNLASLTTQDLVNIRRDDATFAQWRDVLRSTLNAMTSLPSLPDAVRDRQFQQSLSAATGELNRRLTSPFWQDIVQSGKDITLAFVVAGLVLGGGPVAPVAATAAGGMLYNYLVRDAKQRTATKALRRHISIVTP